MALLLLFGGAAAVLVCLVVAGSFLGLGAFTVGTGGRWFAYVLAAFFAVLAVWLLVAVGAHLDIRMT